MRRTIHVAALGMALGLVLGSTFALAATAMSTARIEQLTGTKVAMDEKEGVFRMALPRTDLKVSVAGARVTHAMGLTCWAAFAGSDGRAVVGGDSAMYEGEVQGVLKALRGAGIDIVAIHHHMIEETRRVLFLHLGGVGPSARLVEGVRAALKTQGL